jgi:hypothetical protein
MSSQHIEIQSTASRLSAEVRSMVDGLRDIQERAIKVVDIIQQVASGEDYAALAAKLGVSEADAQVVYNLVVGLVAGETPPITGSAVNQVIDRLG